MRRNERRDVEFVLRIEPAIRFRHFLPEQAIGADQFAILKPYGVVGREGVSVNDQQMIANGIEAIRVGMFRGSRLRTKLKAQTLGLAGALARIQHLATRDELTQLINRRHMADVMENEAARRDRSGTALCLAVIDIDHFKRVNDTLGHAAGDSVLRRFAEQALAAVRRNDVLARWGGEGFLLLLPFTCIDDAQAVLERIRERVRESVRHGEGLISAVTFSAGLAESPAGESIDAAIERADQSMYRAKREGRDRIVCAPHPPAGAAAKIA